MPTLDVVRSSRVEKTFRVRQVLGMFDVPDKTAIEHRWRVEMPVHEQDWTIGLIVGPSGAGKSVIAREAFPDALFVDEPFEWPKTKSILDGFPEGIETRQIVETLSMVGLSAPPLWLKPYGHLSNGQRFRCDLALSVSQGKPLVVFDEFTSVVDRDVAKCCSSALAKTLRKRGGTRFVAVSCHFDIVEWLQPDWSYDVAAARFEWRQRRRRPEVSLAVHRVGREAWTLFRGHHYLSADIHRAARCYAAFWNDKPVAFVATLPSAGIKRAYREHRLVVLPDYQGVGIGNAMSEFIANVYVSQGLRYFSCTSHPGLIYHRAKSLLWRNQRLPKSRGIVASKKGYGGGTRRGSLTATFEFLGRRPE